MLSRKVLGVAGLLTLSAAVLTPAPRPLTVALAGRFPVLQSRLQSPLRFEPDSWLRAGRRTRGYSASRAADGDRARLRIPAVASDELVADGEGVRVVVASRDAAAAAAEVEEAALTYRDVYPSTDVLHVAQPEWTEEYLHLRSEKAPRHFEYDVLETSGVTRVELANGQVRFLDARGRGLVVLAPVVVDAAGRRSATAARWSIETANGTRRLELDLEPEGLEYPLLVDPTWITTTSLSTARSDGTGILLQNGKVVVLGFANTAELYDPATGTWSTTGAGWAARGYAAATLLRDGRVLACGGVNFSVFAECRKYDPDANTWTLVASMSTPREHHTLTLLADGRVLAAGGEPAANSPLASAEVYDPAANTWSPTGAMVFAHRSHGAVLLPGGKVLVAGGVTLPGPSTTKESEVYDPGTGTWTRVGDLAGARDSYSLTLLPNATVLAAGGSFGVATAELFNPGTGLWSATGGLTTARGEHSATLLPGGRVVAAGGSNGSIFNSTELYNYTSGTWAAGPPMTFARYRQSATMLADGRVLVAGGFNGPAIATAELLDVDAPSWAAAGNLNANRSESSLTLLKSGKALAVGGVSLDTAETYDPGSSSWTPTANNLSVQRWRHTATLLGDGTVLVAGSAQSSAAGRSAELYDPGTDTWSATASMSTDRNWHTATLLPCGEVLVAGGQTAAGVVLASAERYNPKTRTWRPAASLITGRWRATATLLVDGRVLVTGGFNGSVRASAELYDPNADTWTATTGNMTVARYHHDATLLPSGKVLIAGGLSTPTAELFNPATGTFTGTGFPSATLDMGVTATLLPNGRVLAVGGALATTASTIYDPGAGAWTAGPAVSPSRDRHAATLLLDGRVLVAGNVTSGNTSALYNVGRGEAAAWRPTTTTVTDPVIRGGAVAVTGTGFQGLGEGSTGLGYMQSATNYPLVQLRRADNGQIRWLPVDPVSGWSGTSFRSTALSGFPNGPALVTVFTSGIPGASLQVAVECPAPSINVPPANATVCAGSSATFTVTATAAGSDCPAYQWRKDGVPLAEGAPFTGTQTQTLVVAPATAAEVGSYDVQVSLACSSTVVTSSPATLSLTPSIGAVHASIAGPASVCTTCTGGTAAETHSGGGVVVGYQWGFRTTSEGPITNIPSATSATYVVNGADFPGAGNYLLVVRVTPTCGAPTLSDEAPVHVSGTTAASNEVPFFTVTSRDSRNVLEWIYPAAFTSVRIRYTTGEPCAYPADGDLDGFLLADRTGSAGGYDSVAHDPVVNGTNYCYTVFVATGAPWSAGRTNSGKPFSTAGALQWVFHSGGFSTTAPTVGAAGVIAVNNDGAVHAMKRGPAGGEWPAGWKPVRLGGVVQNRSPIVPIPVGASSNLVFLGAQDGALYAVDAAKGAAAASPWPGSGAAGGLVQAAPAGLFTAFGGAFDYLTIGTREASSNNFFRAYDPASGALVGSFGNGGSPNGIGIISGMAAVDYPTSRVYFTSRARTGGSANTLWCLRLGAAPNVFTLVWARNDLGDIDSSPVLRGGRVYVGGTAAGGTLYSIDAATGSPANDRSYVHGDGPVKGFVFPDRASPTGDLYFATNTAVWGITEVGATLASKYGSAIVLPNGAAPSTLLFHPGSHYLYVGGSDGWLYQIDTLGAPPTADWAAQLGPAPLTIGAPSLDIGTGLVHVGAENGEFFAVAVPVPPANLCTNDCTGKPPGLACTTSAPPCTQACDGAGHCN